MCRHECRLYFFQDATDSHLFTENEADCEGARKFSAKVRDISEFLVDLGLVAPLRPLPMRVTYQDSCHLVHGQKIREAPR